MRSPHRRVVAHLGQKPNPAIAMLHQLGLLGAPFACEVPGADSHREVSKEGIVKIATDNITSKIELR
jgi:hypothetical protein